MTRRLLWLVPVILLLAACPGGEPGTATPPVASPSTSPAGTLAPSSQAGRHFLLGSVGVISIKRQGWVDYVPAAFGAALNSADLMQVQGHATVLCGDLQVKQVASGLQSTPCPPGPIVIKVGAASVVLAYRGAAQLRPAMTTPYILYPRKTLLLTDHPLLRWHDTGAAPYTVTVRLGGSPVWQQIVATTDVRYPDGAQPLQPGSTYTLAVTDKTGASSAQDPSLGIGFQVATPEALGVAADLKNKAAAVPSLSEADRQFVLAALYLSLENKAYVGSTFRPLGDAWQLLDEVAASHPAPAVHLAVGNVLAEMALPGEAEVAYRAALDSASAIGDRESQALAHAQLWRLLGAPDDLQEAISLYEQLGDAAAAAALKAEAAQ